MGWKWVSFRWTALFAFGFLNDNLNISYSYDHTLAGDIANILMDHMN